MVWASRFTAPLEVSTMRTLPLLSSVGLVIALALVGCTANTSSRNIRTAGMVALIDVSSSSAQQSTVGMKLVVGGANSNTYVMLEQGDTVSATAGGQTQPMQAVSSGEYEVRFPVAEGQFVVTLTRSADQEQMVSSGTMPPPFEITTQFPAKHIRRNKPVTVEWAPAGTQAQVTVEIDGDCIHSDKFTTGDTGSFTIPGGKIQAWKSKEDQECRVTMTVTRSVAGQTAPSFDSDSRFVLRQVRSTSFVTARELTPEEKAAKKKKKKEQKAKEQQEQKEEEEAKPEPEAANPAGVRVFSRG
jgi:hypothetical protein